jgi:hypothetical protein
LADRGQAMRRSPGIVKSSVGEIPLPERQVDMARTRAGQRDMLFVDEEVGVEYGIFYGNVPCPIDESEPDRAFAVASPYCFDENTMDDLAWKDGEGHRR